MVRRPIRRRHLPHGKRGRQGGEGQSGGERGGTMSRPDRSAADSTLEGRSDGEQQFEDPGSDPPRPGWRPRRAPSGPPTRRPAREEREDPPGNRGRQGDGRGSQHRGEPHSIARQEPAVGNRMR